LQVDEYSRKRTEEISEAVAESIRKVVAETQTQQQQLLSDALIYEQLVNKTIAALFCYV